MATPTLVDQTWESIQSKTLDAIKTHFPVESTTRQLVLHDVSFGEKEADQGDIRSQEAAKDHGRTWGVPVYGDVSLVDKSTGKVMDRAKVKLLTLPKPTSRYSYIVDGSEWQADNLWRLRSGIYAHAKQNGEFQAEFNLSKSFARNPRLYIPFNPESRKFKLTYGDSHVPLYSVLKTLGVQDVDMKKSWGEDIYKANIRTDHEKKVLDFYNKLAKHGGIKAVSDKLEDKAAAIVQAFHATELQPDITKVVLGKAIDHVSGEALLLASTRILKVAKGEIPQDDRDSLVFKDLHSVDDFIQEKLTQYHTKKTVKQKINNNLDRQDKVRDIINGELFGKPVHDFFTSSSVSRNPEQVNPLEMLSNHRSTTIIAPGYGGITDDDKVVPHMKLINPSHLGFLDPLHTPESSRTGITLHLPIGVKKDGNQAKVAVYDTKSSKMEYVTPGQLHSEHVVLPDQVKWENGKPVPISSSVKMKDPSNHEILEKPFGSGRYVLLSAHQLFDEASNLIPFLQNNQGNRTMTAARQATQAVSLHHREEPLVQVRSGSTNQTWEKVFGTPWATTAHIDGQVSAIKLNKDNGHADAIIIKDSAGKPQEIQLHNHFALNDSKSFLHNTPQVAVGDKVKAGDIIADSNFTRNGHLTLGTNLRVSYLPYKGYNFEDGIVISESASKKLSSEHVHRQTLDINPESDHVSKSKFIAYASTTAKKMTKAQADKLGDDGVIKVGQLVETGDTLVGAIGKASLDSEAARSVGRLDKRMFAVKDKSIAWESQHPGQVVKVVKTPNGKGITVHVKTIEPAEIGDKIVGRHGNKGILTRILPDAEMPRIGGPDGEHVQILMNPSGIPTRINLGQMLETAAAKIAHKTGKPYIVQNFAGSDTDYTQNIKNSLKKEGLSDTDNIYDPETGKMLGEALTGHQYIMKLKHQVEHKISVRSEGPGYTLDHAPSGTGSSNPGQAMGQLEFYALLAHGARANLREMATYKADRHLGDRNDQNAHIEFWNKVKSGQPLPAPTASFAYKKFETLLTGLGVNIKKDGSQLTLTPLTDKGVLAISHGEIADPGRILRGKDAKELEHGLFDKKVTGGLPNDTGKGLKWSHITLAEPLPNPVFVGSKQHPGPAVALSGLKFDEFEDVAKGKKYIDGKTGGYAIKDLLNKVDVKKELSRLKEELPSLRGSKLDKANSKVRYLRALDGLKLKPADAYVMNHVPVIPPIFRPIIPMHDGSLRFDDINHYYRSLGNINNQLKTKTKDLPDDTHQDLREQSYDILKALQGLGGTPTYQSQRAVPMKGIMDQIAGDAPKMGFFQRRLMKRRQELSMRSTIIPDPTMHLDHVGIPKDAALELYKPFVVRELQKRGYGMKDGLGAVKNQTPAAWQALQAAMDQRPVLLKRDPALHKFSIMAFKPKLVEGKAIQIHPLVTGGFNADFDGDTMSAFVPLTDAAVKESEKMYPSNNLFSPTHGGVMYAPEQESLLGLHLLSKWGKDVAKKFNTVADAQKASDLGHIHVTDVVTIGGQKTTLGRMLIGKHLPDSVKDDKLAGLLQDPKFELVKKTKGDRLGVHNLLDDIAHKDPKNYATTVDNLKNLGNRYSYELGFSIGLKDLHVDKEIRKVIMDKADAEAKVVRGSSLSKDAKDDKTIDIYTKATDALEKANLPQLKKNDNKIFTMVDSGVRGKMGQFRQMVMAPMLMQDGSGKTLATPVKKSYSEGLDIGDYWTALHGARKGTLQRVEGTSEPGVLTKEIINVLLPSLVVSRDCGTTQGISMGIHEDDFHDRHLAVPVKVGDNTLKAGTVIDAHVAGLLKKHKIDKVVVRSPLKCQHGQGICATCYGLNENGKLHEVGTNIGVIAGQSLGEPAVQLVMDCNASGNLVTVRSLGKINTITFEQLWNHIDGFVDESDGVETKIPDSVDVWDHTSFVPIKVIQRHKPHSKMVMVRLDSGHAFISQSTHPNWGRLNTTKCPNCGDEEPISFIGHHRTGNRTAVRCASCRKNYLVSRDAYEGQQERVIKSAQLKGVFLGVSSHQCDSKQESPLPPYLLGMYLAEGNVKRIKVSNKLEPGTKHRNNSPFGMKWKILGIVFTQNPGEIRDQIKHELTQHKIDFVEPSNKHVQLGDVSLARKLWNLCGIASSNKQFPPGWLSQTQEWKLEALAGLLDGDGTLLAGHTANLDTTSWGLVSQVQEMVRSLGGWSTVYASTITELTRNQGYRVVIDLPMELPSIKLFPTKSVSVIKTQYSKVVQVKEVEFYDDWTYDLATSTRGFTASGVRTHNSFHSGGIASGRGGSSTNRLTRLKQLLNIPKTLPNAATMATMSGTVDKIEKDHATNGHFAHIADAKHFIPAQREVTVKVGDHVKKGDALSDGHINPLELLKHTDIHNVQNYISNELYHSIYKDEHVRRRNIETVVRSTTNLTTIKDPGSSDHLHGDIALRTVVEEQNRKMPKGHAPILHEPVIRRTQDTALDQHEDWLARLNFQHLKSTVMEGASKGWKSNLHGLNPVGAYAHGAEFGLGTPANPHHY